MARVNKAHYERETKTYIPPKVETKQFKDPNAPRKHSLTLCCFEHRPKIKGERSGLSFGDVTKKWGERWSDTVADDQQPYEKKGS